MSRKLYGSVRQLAFQRGCSFKRLASGKVTVTDKSSGRLECIGSLEEVRQFLLQSKFPEARESALLKKPFTENITAIITAVPTPPSIHPQLRGAFTRIELLGRIASSN